MDKDTRTILRLKDLVEEIESELLDIEKIINYKTITSEEKLDRIHKIAGKLSKRINESSK